MGAFQFAPAFYFVHHNRRSMMIAPLIDRKIDVCEKLRISLSALDRMIANNEFPKPIRLSPRSVGWPVSVAEKFIADKVAAAMAAVRGERA
jgi:predicted DNA-binding transcriptional regulator AlpA